MPLGQDDRERAFRFASDMVDLYERLHRQGGTPQLLSKNLVRSAIAIGIHLEQGHTTFALDEAREVDYLIRVLKRSSVAVTEKIEKDVAELVARLASATS